MPTLDAPQSTPGPRCPPRLLLWLAILAAVSPNIIWAFTDRTAWPWDEAWYGKTSVDLFYTLIYSPSAWIPAMMDAFGRAAPGIAWVGQFFVPIGRMARSIDAGLLLSVVSAQAIALYLVARAVWDLSGGSRAITCAGVLVMAAAPLFVGLSHHYLVEMQQVVAVGWFMLIMVRARRWSLLFTIGQLVLATTAAMLAKVSSPLYCFGPGLAAMYSAVRYGSRSVSALRSRSIVTLVIGVPPLLATIAWYQRNIHYVVEHVSLASTGRVAELYGKADAFLQSFTFWTTAFGKNFFTTLTIAVAAIVLAAAVVTLFNDRRPTQHRLYDAAAIVAAVQILVTLAVFSLSSNRDDRYLLPLVPYAALLVSWALVRLNRPAITLVVMACFAFQWGHTHAQALGLVRMGTAVPWLTPVMRDPDGRALLDSLVDRTCADTQPGFHSNVIGVQLLWLNAPGVSYAASKRLAPSHRMTCDYNAVDYYDTDEGAAWTRLLGRNLTYYISLDASAYEIPPDPVYTTINALNQPILKRIETSGQFQLEPALVRRPGLLIFKSVADRVDHLTQGRSLSDRGAHALAIEELKRAATLQPENVEAWANLALAYERAGNVGDVVTAGDRALSLNSKHYYVNWLLARALLEQRDWTTAIARAEVAASNAPGASERASALTLAARGAFGAGDAVRGCDFLRMAGNLPKDPEILNQMSTSGCRR